MREISGILYVYVNSGAHVRCAPHVLSSRKLRRNKDKECVL